MCTSRAFLRCLIYVSPYIATMSCVPSSRKCFPATASGNADLAALVRLYRIHNRPHSEREIEFFRNMPSLELAVHHAALATDSRGKRYGPNAALLRHLSSARNKF